MEKVIGGLRYNTDAATKIAETESEITHKTRQLEILYKTPNGRFFLYRDSWLIYPRFRRSPPGTREVYEASDEECHRRAIACYKNLPSHLTSPGHDGQIIPIDRHRAISWLESNGHMEALAAHFGIEDA